MFRHLNWKICAAVPVCAVVLHFVNMTNEDKTLNPVVPVRQACFEMVGTSPDVILILPQDETCWCTQLLRREPEESLPTCLAKMR